VNNFERLKREYDHETNEGEKEEKWAYFNQIAEEIYKLAGETITTKINRSMEQ
jgi:hypothetical protein